MTTARSCVTPSIFPTTAVGWRASACGGGRAHLIRAPAPSRLRLYRQRHHRYPRHHPNRLCLHRDLLHLAGLTAPSPPPSLPPPFTFLAAGAPDALSATLVTPTLTITVAITVFAVPLATSAFATTFSAAPSPPLLLLDRHLPRRVLHCLYLHRLYRHRLRRHRRLHRRRGRLHHRRLRRRRRRRRRRRPVTTSLTPATFSFSVSATTLTTALAARASEAAATATAAAAGPAARQQQQQLDAGADGGFTSCGSRRYACRSGTAAAVSAIAIDAAATATAAVAGSAARQQQQQSAAALRSPRGSSGTAVHPGGRMHRKGASKRAQLRPACCRPPSRRFR